MPISRWPGVPCFDLPTFGDYVSLLQEPILQTAKDFEPDVESGIDNK
jgi:hypothetical protein